MSRFSLFLVLFISLCRAKPEDPFTFESHELPRNPDGTINQSLLPSIGNGHLATTLYTDAIFIDGLYNGKLGDSHRAKVPAIFAAEFEIEGCKTSQQVKTYRIETKRAMFIETVYCGQAGMSVITYAHNDLDRLLVSEMHIWNPQAQNSTHRVNVQSLSDFSSDDFDWYDSNEIPTHTGMHKHGVIKEAEKDDITKPEVHVYYNQELPKTLELNMFEFSKSFFFLMAIDTNQSKALSDFNESLRLLDLDGIGEKLAENHVSNWNNIWENGLILLEGQEGDVKLQEAIVGSFYYLYSSLPSKTSVGENFFGLSPGGLANGKKGRDYQGHVFWDMETWMYPSILPFRPDLAREMLNYRIRNMPQAIKRATETGYCGARYPWESAYSGIEVTPAPACANNEQHITGDVSFALRSYIALTQDFQWLSEQVEDEITPLDFALNMARFWESRPTYNESKGQWEINGVMPPDEYQENINNSIFTNLVANYAVNTARWISCLAGKENQVPEDWLEKMKNLVFTYNKERRNHEEYEGFVFESDKKVKQADVVLLNYPLNWKMPADVLFNDLLFYEEVTDDNGPAMTWSIFAINYLDLEEYDLAKSLFYRSYQPYVKEPFNIWTEVKNGVGAVNFITGAGGFLQSLIYGYAGIQIRPYAMSIKSRTVLPPSTERIILKGLTYLSTKFDLTITQTEFKLTCKENGILKVLVRPADGQNGTELLCSQEPVDYVFEKQDLVLENAEQNSCPQPKDEINVNYDN